MTRTRPLPSIVLLAAVFVAAFVTVRIVLDTPKPKPVAATTVASSAVTSPPSATVSVGIANFAFDPDPITVATGTAIVWTNNDSFAHTATGDDTAVFDSGKLEQGQSFTHKFDTAGTFTYKCAIHNSMTGTVVVQ